MDTRSRAAMALIFGACMLAASARAGEPACKLSMVASFDFAEDASERVIVPATVDGVETHLLVDTGAAATTVSGRLADRLKLHRNLLEGRSADDMTGRRAAGSITTLESVRTGTLHAADVRALIDEHWRDPKSDGVLGPDFLMQFEVEIDFARHKMNLFVPDHCPGEVVYWTHDPVAVIPVEIDRNGHVVVDAALDGRAVQGIVDTGAGLSSMWAYESQILLGIDETSSGVMPEHVGPGTSNTYRYTFKALVLPGMTFANPVVRLYANHPFRDDPLGNKLLIGRHELSKLHLFVSYKERKIYATAADAH
jgi:predicted aspartyl protease